MKLSTMSALVAGSMLAAGAMLVPAAPAFAAGGCGWASTGTIHGDASLKLVGGDCVSPHSVLLDGAEADWYVDEDDTSRLTIVVQLADVPAGSHTIRALDDNDAQLASGTFTVTRAEPIIEVLSPQDDEYIGSRTYIELDWSLPAELEGTATNVDLVDDKGDPVDSYDVTELQDGEYVELFLDTTKYSNGDHDFTVVTYFEDGSFSLFDLPLTIENHVAALASSAPTAFNYGGTFNYSALLTDKETGKPIPNEIVTLAMGKTTAASEPVQSAKTNAAGKVTFKVKATSEQTYFAYFSGYTEDEDNFFYKPLYSPGRTVKINAVGSFKTTAVKQVHGKAFGGQITIDPGSKGVGLSVQVQSGSTWKQIASTKTTGRVTKLSFTFATKGTYKVRVVRANGGGANGFTSNVLTLTVT